MPNHFPGIPGVCPKCSCDELYFGPMVPEESWVYYPYECAGCKFKGREYYNLEFDCHVDSEGTLLKQ